MSGKRTQYLLFSVGEDRYALEARAVKEIFPAFGVKRLPGAPTGVIGVIDFHGKVIPAIDLSLMLTGSVAKRGLSTRFLVVNLSGRGEERLVAVLVEKATEIVGIAEDDFQPLGVEGEPCLSQIYRSPKGLVQRVEASRLLTEEVYTALCKKIEDDGQS